MYRVMIGETLLLMQLEEYILILQWALQMWF